MGDGRRTTALVRPATLADADDIARVHIASWRAAYPGMIPQEILDGLSLEQRTDRWTKTLAATQEPGSREVVFVAGSGSLLGFAHAAPSDDADADPGRTALLHAIYLDEGAWGTGAGAALHERTIAALQAHGFSDATLWVIEANSRARRFYEARGWRPDGSSKTCFGIDVNVDVPTLRYRRDLG